MPKDLGESHTVPIGPARAPRGREGDAAGTHGIARRPALIVSCTDMDRSERFYRDVLGAVPDPREEGGCRWLLLDGLPLSLVPNAVEAAGLSTRPAAFNLAVEVDDLDAFGAMLARQGVTFLQPPDGTLTVIADPDGLAIEIWQR